MCEREEELTLIHTHTRKVPTKQWRAGTMKNLPRDIDIRDLVPISRAAAGLAEFIKKVRDTRQPLLITQNGYASAVLMDVESYTELRELAECAVVQFDKAEREREHTVVQPEKVPEEKLAECTI